MRYHPGKILQAGAVAIVAGVGLAACGAAPGSGGGTGGGGGGSGQSSLTVMEVSQTWPSLDPVTDTGATTDVNYLDAIYGQLFTQKPGGAIVPGMASGYTFAKDDKTVTIHLRPGLKFSDGTPLNAAAVKANLDRALDPGNACVCYSNIKTIGSVTTSGSDIVLHLTQPNPTIIQAMVGNAPDWVPSPTALAKKGESAFGQSPVGAGPFQVVSNVASSKLVLKANPGYYVKGEPKLSSLTFLTVPNDQSAFAALESGNVQLVMGLTTPQIIQQAQSQYQTETVKGVQAYEVAFNTRVAPFSNPAARQAVAYATSAAQTLQSANPGIGSVTQTTTGPGGLFYTPAVAGFKAYDLAKAKQLVQQLGGLSFSIFYGNNMVPFIQGAEALQREWSDAGIKATLQPVVPSNSSAIYHAGKWQATWTVAGAIDPDVGSGGLPTRFGSGGVYSGVNDPQLDKLIGQSQQETDATARAGLIKQAFQRITDQTYALPLFTVPSFLVGEKSLTGLTATPTSNAGKEIVQWDQVAFS